jgi:hypothetical protein
MVSMDVVGGLIGRDALLCPGVGRVRKRRSSAPETDRASDVTSKGGDARGNPVMTRSCVQDPRETMGIKPHRAVSWAASSLQPAGADATRCQEDGSLRPAHAGGAPRLRSRRRSALAATRCNQALDQQQRGGTTERYEPGADAEERGGRTHADERREDTTKHSPEDADQQSVHLRFAVGWNGTRDPARDNSQDHPSGEGHCAPLSMNAGHEHPWPVRIRSPTMLPSMGRSANTT